MRVTVVGVFSKGFTRRTKVPRGGKTNSAKAQTSVDAVARVPQQT